MSPAFGSALLASLALLLGCGEAARSLTVEIAASATAGLDPYDPSVQLTKVRVEVDGAGQYDDASADLGLDERSATFTGLPRDVRLEVRAEGYSELGNIVAFARHDGLPGGDDAKLTLSLRRNLAYVSHLANPRQRAPDSHLYVIDIATRTRIGKIRLPGSTPIAGRVSARGGASILVPYEDSGVGHLGILSLDSHEWQSIDLPRFAEMALGSPAGAIGVVVGGGGIAFVDLDQASLVEEFPMRVGGRVLDGTIAASGRRALVIVDIAPGILSIDLEARRVEALNVVAGPSGVALAADGRVAYITSSVERTVVAIDLENGRTSKLGGFVKPVGAAAYSEAMQAVFAIDTAESGSGRVLSFVAPADEGLRLDEATQTLPFPSDVQVDASGRRVLVVAAGSSTATAGLTAIDTFSDRAPVGSSALYPLDPDDTYVEGGGFVASQRYRPRSLAVVYGR